MYGMRVIFIIVVSSIFDVSSVGLFGNDVDSKQLLHHLTESEKLFLFGSNNKDPQFEIAHLKRQKRRKRSLSTDNHELAGLKKHLNIKLSSRHNFIDPQFLLMKRWSNGTEAVLDKYMDNEVDLCFYKSETAALYVCEDVRGVVKSNDSYYSIHPLPERFHNENLKPHIIVKRADLENNKDVENICVEKDSLSFTENSEPIKMWSKHRRKRETRTSVGNENSLHKFKLNLAHRNKTISDFVEKLVSQENQTDRQKRSVLPAIFVETAVFVDRDLYKLMTINFLKDTERELVRFVLAMINAVQLIYHDPSLGRPVNFILKRLEILHEDPANLKRPHDIDRFLSNFCTWQRLENPPGDNDPLHWDHALILTGLDLYVVNKNGKVSSQVVGLAPVAGMCTVTSSCTVNEGRHFESVYVVAHEIGHNLGMRHDGPNADNACDPSAFIMSPTLGSGKITWSQCSRNYLQKFLDTSQSRCLLDHGNSAGQLDHSAEGILPGERFDADQQCMLKYGRGSRQSSSQSTRDVCRDLHCARERYTWTSHPALEGTRCGDDMYCRGGQCVAVPGGGARWGRWSSWSECASSCLWDARPAAPATGVALATRRCTRPRLENGKSYCQGHDKKYQSCYAHQCKTVPKMTVRDFADQICRRARDFDPDLIGTGLQRLDTDDTQSACAVWCDTRGGGYKSRGWTFPDGTACSNEANKFCISGACRKFSCLSNIDTEFSLTSRDCEWEALQVQTATPHTTKSSGTWRRAVDGRWRAASACHYRCMAPGTGLRVVRASDRDNIQLCTPDTHTTREGCSQQMSPYQFATMVCSKYKERVRRLSGLGMQISPAVEEPDRPCRIACQDERVSHRFYLVNGHDGWFPLGTACGSNHYCVGGRCLEFGPDLTPLSEMVFTLPSSTLVNNTRHRRSLYRDRLTVSSTLDTLHLRHIIATLNLTDNTRGSAYFQKIPDDIDVDFTNPIHISPEDTFIRKKPRPTWD